MAALYSARIIIKPFSGQDAPQSFSWFGDSKVMKFMLKGPDANLNETLPESLIINSTKSAMALRNG
ncbi:MAG: hypothetical protein PHG00_00025 [Methylococcales bacterium]|nr:hypothetical protein [Methylococcales bacterium]